MIRGRTFVVFSDDWGRHPSSCQHLFRGIAALIDVIWVNTIGTRTPSLTPADLRRALGKLREWTSKAEAGAEEQSGSEGGGVPVEVLRPVMTPFDRWRPFRRLNTRLLVRAVTEALAARGDEAPILVTTIPNAAGVVGQVGEAASLYYCVDEFSEWPGADREAMLEMERELLGRVDLVVATSQTLFEEKSARHARVRLLKHGVDWQSFRRPPTEAPPPSLAALPRPVAGFTGLADARLDVRLLAEVADRLPGTLGALISVVETPTAVVRTHDPEETAQFLEIAMLVREATA